MSGKRLLSCLHDRVICSIVTPLTEASEQCFCIGTGDNSYLHLDVYFTRTSSACIQTPGAGFCGNGEVATHRGSAMNPFIS